MTNPGKGSPVPGPGGLIYVVGPSGAGKDTLLQWVRTRLAAERPALPVAFSHRYITRGPGAGGESHVPLDPVEFAARRKAGLFAMTWEGHGLAYGIGIEIDLWRRAGMTVVVNGSRAHLVEAVRHAPDLTPVLVTASRDVLRHRLESRGREPADRIAARLARAASIQVVHPALTKIENDGPVAQGGRALMRVIVDRAETAMQEASRGAGAPAHEK